MAKVRIQARSADADDAAEQNGLPPPAHADRHPHHKNIGAIGILKRVWERDGFRGWYRVSFLAIISSLSIETSSPFCSLGNAITDHKSCSITRCTFHVERAVRALGTTHHRFWCTTFCQTVTIFIASLLHTL
jgi:hypothetical protein